MRLSALLPVIALALAGCQPTPPAELQAGEEAPGFSLPAVGGGELALVDDRGVQPVLLFFHLAAG
jgi:hypothetical protein